MYEWSKDKNSEFKRALILLAVMFVLALPTAAQQYQYLINGKPVEKNVYTAALLVQEASKLILENNLDRAGRKLRMALQYEPNFVPAHSLYGIILAREGKNAEALQHLRKSVQSDDCSAAAYFNLASFYQGTGKLDSAIETFNLFLSRSNDEGSKEEVTKIVRMLERERELRKKTGIAARKNEETDYLVMPDGHPLPRWTDFRMPLKVFIDPSTDAEGFKPEYADLLKEAFIDWDHACNKRISFIFVPQKENCDIYCAWTDDPDKLGKGTENGNATTYSRAGVLDSAQIMLRSKEAEGSFPFNDNSVLSTCRHEVGHALGLSCHSTNANDIMYFSPALADRDQKISERDRNTILKLYSTSVPWLPAFLDFVCRPSNAPVCTVAVFSLLVAGVLARVALASLGRTKKKKKKKKQASA